MTDVFRQKVKNTIKRHNLILRGDTILIGVSGGPDSLALLYALNGLKKEFKLKLHIAHLDHMLRKDSVKDALFVKRLASDLKLPITAAQANIKALAKHGSLEEIARNARLSFLFRVAGEIKADKIALGHNLDDQAETVLMRLLRGTGLYGLSGILPKRNLYGHEVIRPLLEIQRKEIEVFLKRKGIKPRIDTSNRESIYFRNQIRNNLLPALERSYSKNIKELLANLAQTAGYDYDYLDRAAARSIRGPGAKLDLKKFSKLHPAIRRIVLRLMIKRLKGNTRTLNLQHIREMEDLILNRPVNSIVDLPKGISVKKGKKTLLFYRR